MASGELLVLPAFKRVVRELKQLEHHAFYSGPFAEYSDFIAAEVIWDIDPLKQLLPGQSQGELLDVGCGSGRLAVALANEGWRVCGADRSSEACESFRTVAISPAHAERLRVVNADVLDSQAELGGPFSAAVLGDLSVNAFASSGQLRMLLDRLSGELANDGSIQFVVLDESAMPSFNHLDGRIRPIPFWDRRGNQRVMWAAYRFEQSSHGVLGNYLLEIPGRGATLRHCFSFSVERIWTLASIEKTLDTAGWSVIDRLECRIEGGALDGALAWAAAAARAT